MITQSILVGIGCAMPVLGLAQSPESTPPSAPAPPSEHLTALKIGYARGEYGHHQGTIAYQWVLRPRTVLRAGAGYGREKYKSTLPGTARWTR